ncbi:MAG: hypothetical protein H7647_05740, partial [Candidatus Heimdallarchaeota archaeon]|nr:hypothetical protein [Candidatus Heimdallarchaeota archaeon]MCK4253927.1 hypothetical protein [Candidatus Heimdallarchaeota archaeon]
NTTSTTEDDFFESIVAPETFNTTFLNNVTYGPSVKKDVNLKWKVGSYEKTDNFHVAEGDKNLKNGDQIILQIGSDPYLQLPNVDAWCQIYINDVMARYPNLNTRIYAVFKYILPITLNLSEHGINYTTYFSYLENSVAVDQSYWTFEEDKVTYNYTSITEINNVTDISMIYNRETGIMDKMFYSASFTNATGHFAGVNFTLTRLHGWGLPYNVTTLVVWIPIFVLLVGLIVAIRLHAFQRFKLYLEARKIVKRGE